MKPPRGSENPHDRKKHWLDIMVGDQYVRDWESIFIVFYPLRPASQIPMADTLHLWRLGTVC